MNIDSIKKQLVHDLVRTRAIGDLPLFRNDEDRLFLFRWLSGSDERAGACRGLNSSAVQALIERCGKCGGSVEKKIGYGTGKNGVMIILNSPVLVNKLEKDLLKKESIDLLKKIVKSLNLDVNDCFITSLIKCEIENSLMRPSQVFENCGDIISAEIACFSPRIIIVMGDIIPLQKIIKESTGISWHNIEHPITLIKNPDLKRRAWETLKLVIEKIKEY
jgi:uracil-DNA glycosylase family 4